MATAAKALKFEEVESSNVHSWAYDAERQVIVVRFHNGTQGEYANCNAADWKACQKAKSAGKHIGELRKHPWNRIDDWK